MSRTLETWTSSLEPLWMENFDYLEQPWKYSNTQSSSSNCLSPEGSTVNRFEDPSLHQAPHRWNNSPLSRESPFARSSWCSNRNRHRKTNQKVYAELNGSARARARTNRPKLHSISFLSRNTKSSQTTSPWGTQQDAQGRELFCHVKCEAQEFEAVTMNPGPGNWETGSR